jgi:hypothetical protein
LSWLYGALCRKPTKEYARRSALARHGGAVAPAGQFEKSIVVLRFKARFGAPFEKRKFKWTFTEFWKMFGQIPPEIAQLAVQSARMENPQSDITTETYSSGAIVASIQW